MNPPQDKGKAGRCFPLTRRPVTEVTELPPPALLCGYAVVCIGQAMPPL